MIKKMKKKLESELNEKDKSINILKSDIKVISILKKLANLKK